VSGHWISGEIDWNEFNEVISGNGPCNLERVKVRKKAKEDGAWVREAAMAFAIKKNKF
jgi:ring-1,2-phenylacetyl-CoA epoxidase subunit PaaA